jgi:hypothetical protein
MSSAFQNALWILCRSWGSSVSIVSDYRLNDRGSIPAEAKDFPLATVSVLAPRITQRPVRWVPGILYNGGKARLGRGSDHSPPSSAEVKNE